MNAAVGEDKGPQFSIGENLFSTTGVHVDIGGLYEDVGLDEGTNKAGPSQTPATTSPIEASPIQWVDGNKSGRSHGVDEVESPEYRTPPERYPTLSPPSSPENPGIGKRVPRKSELIRGDYICDPKIRALFASIKKAEYTPLAAVDNEDYLLFKSILTKSRDM